MRLCPFDRGPIVPLPIDPDVDPPYTAGTATHVCMTDGVLWDLGGYEAR